VCIAVAALAVAVAAGGWSIQEGRAAARRPPSGGEAADPDDPLGRLDARTGARKQLFEPWMVVTAALLIAGLVIAPRLFGITFLLLPFLFGGRRRPPQRPNRPGDDPRWSSTE